MTSRKLALLALLVVLYTAGWAFATDPTITGPSVIRSGNLAVFNINHATPGTEIAYLPKGASRYFHRCGNEIIFARRTEGVVKIIILEDRPDDVYVYKFIFQNSDDGPLPPDPGPDPGPDPPDPIPPDPQPGPRQVCFVAEATTLATLPRSQQTMLASSKLQEELKAAGHTYIGSLDPQIYGVKCVSGVCGTVVDAPADYKAWLEKAKGHKLPVLLTAPVAGGDIKVEPLPASTEELWKIIGRKP